MEKIYDHKNCTVELFDDIPAVYITLKGFIKDQVYKQISEDRLDLFKKHNIKYLVTDAREMKVLSQESQKYNKVHFVPALEKMKISKSYMILSEDTFMKLMLNNIDKQLKQSDSAIEVRYFKDPDKGIRELKAAL